MKKIFFKLSCWLVILTVLSNSVYPLLAFAAEDDDGGGAGSASFGDYSDNTSQATQQDPGIPEEPDATPATPADVPDETTSASTAPQQTDSGGGFTPGGNTEVPTGPTEPAGPVEVPAVPAGQPPAQTDEEKKAALQLEIDQTEASGNDATAKIKQLQDLESGQPVAQIPQPAPAPAVVPPPTIEPLSAVPVPVGPTQVPPSQPVVATPTQIEDERKDLADQPLVAKIPQKDSVPVDDPQAIAQVQQASKALTDEVNKAPIVDPKTQDDALGEYDKAATLVADAIDPSQQAAREDEEDKKSRFDKAIADMDATGNRVTGEAYQALHDSIYGAGNVGVGVANTVDGVLNPGPSEEELAKQAADAEAAAKTEQDKVQKQIEDQLGQSLTPEQVGLLNQAMGLPTGLSNEELINYLTGVGAVSNLSVSGTTLDTIQITKPPSTSPSTSVDVKAAVDATLKTAGFVANPVGQLGTLSVDNVGSFIINLGPDAAANNQTLDDLEVLRKQTSFNTPAYLPLNIDEDQRQAQLHKMTTEELQAQVKALIAADPEQGPQKAQQLIADRNYADALVKYDQEQAQRNEKSGQNLLMGTLLAGAAGLAAPVFESLGFGSALLAEKGALSAVNPVVGAVSKIPFVGEAISKIVPGVIEGGKKAIDIQVDLENTRQENKKKEDELKQKAGDLSAAQIVALQNRTDVQVNADFQSCVLTGSGGCDQLKDQKAYADLVKKDDQALSDKQKFAVADIALNSVTGLVNVHVSSEKIKAVLDFGKKVYSYGKKIDKANSSVPSVPSQQPSSNTSGQVLYNGTWVDPGSAGTEDSGIGNEEGMALTNLMAQHSPGNFLITTVLAQEATKSGSIPISQAEYVLRKTRQDMEKQLNEKGTLNFEDTKQKLAKNINISQKGYKSASGVTLITDSNGLAKAPVDQGSYIISVTPAEGVDFTIPKQIKVSNQDLTLAIGIKEGTGQVKNISQGQTLNFLVSNALAAQSAPASVTLTTFYDQNSNGKWDSNEHSVPWAGVEVALKKVNQDNALDLNNGWNLFTLTSLPSKPLTASGLLKDIATQEGYATTVSTLNDGIWQSYVVRGDKTFSGDDFPIEPGKAYFVKTLKKSAYVYQGQEFAVPVKLAIQSGWNAIGIPKASQAYTASKLLDGLNNNKIPSDVVSRWESGLWESLLRANKEDFGNDYAIAVNRGYIIKADTSGEFSP